MPINCRLGILRPPKSLGQHVLTQSIPHSPKPPPSTPEESLDEGLDGLHHPQSDPESHGDVHRDGAKGGLSQYQVTTPAKESPLLDRETVGDLVDQLLHCCLRESP
jgi:hypothetical protein